MIKVVYADDAAHEYFHVTSIDNGLHQGKAYISKDPDLKGILMVRDKKGDFKPDLWNFLEDNLEDGVYKKSDIKEVLLPNVKLENGIH